jgi:hypothetical protein
LNPKLDVSSMASGKYWSLPGTGLCSSTSSFQLPTIAMQNAKIVKNRLRLAATQRAHLHRNIGNNLLMIEI